MKRLWCAAVLLSLTFAGPARAQEWSGAFTIVPVSAPELVLEAVGAGSTPGTVVSIGLPAGAPHQQWRLVHRGGGWHQLRPAHSETLVMAAAAGRTANGTPIVLETASDAPWQLWAVKRNPDDSFSLIPKHAPGQGLDDFGGGKVPGARQDLWTCNPADEHLQWLLQPLPGAKWPASAGDLLRARAPKGVTKDFTFTDSAVFPGTRRSGTVFIPAQYDGRQPACVYVRQDGYNPQEKGLLETLIAAGEIPVMVGVFIRPGDLPAPMPGTLGRRNRCFEYDGVSDHYVRFLVDELLPYVAKTFDLKLSTSGNDRCIAGGSSGGIAAFTAAWHRPDAFSRVYANSGSFVAFRGGHEFPTLIRKTEAKPIRAYLTTGTRDMENCAGDWYLIDLEMDKALKFAGYDYVFRAIDGPHVAGWMEHLREALRFLWRGWPEPVRAGPSAPRVRDVIGTGGRWSLVAEGLGEPRSPVVNSRGEVYYLDSRQNQILRLAGDGRPAVFLADASQATGLAVGPKDELYSVSAGTGRILRHDGATAQPVAEGVPGRYLLARPDGSLYATGAGADGRGTVWLVKDGRATVVDTGLKTATGLAYRPDQWLLAVADGQSKWLYSYQVKPDGTLAHKERYFWLHVPDWEDDAGAESVCYAREGQLLVATRYGIQVCADDGPTQVILPLPGNLRVTGLSFGGPELNTLYAFSGDRLWRRTIKLHGVGAFTPWQAVRGTPL